MSRAALVVGIDGYSHRPLLGCVRDANAIVDVLSHHHDASPNFHCRVLTDTVSRATLRIAVANVFSKKVDIALFYFAGHGARTSLGGLLVTPDGEHGDEGVRMEEVIGLANASPAQERLIILDCCHAGAITELLVTASPASLAEGVAILAACRSNEYAVEHGRRGLFTELVEAAAAGGAADVRGHVTMASVYGYVDLMLTAWDQRPLFLSNLSRLTCMRVATPALNDEKLRRLAQQFPTAEHELRLDPSFEPTALPPHPVNEARFALLQQARAARLVEPVGEEHMYFAAMRSGSCRLTPLGQFYWRAVEKGTL